MVFMFNSRRAFLIYMILFYIVILLFLGSLIFNKYSFSSNLSLGSIFLNSRLTNYLVNFIYLDDLHSRLILKEGLPLVRLENDQSKLEAKNINPVVDFAVSFITDLPASFFDIENNKRAIPVIKQLEIKSNPQLEKKLEAEGSHEDEKVELDFWQTESTVATPRDESLNSQKLEGERVKVERLPLKHTRNDGSPLVGIYHTHTAENYNNHGYNARANPGQRGDIVLIGEQLTKRLEREYNISVIHSQEIHDKTYAKSYINSLYTAQSMAEEYSELEMIFDIHRDAIGKGKDELITTEINGQKVARIMIVITNDNYGLPHLNWEKNAEFARRLASRMNKMYPGLLRDVKLVNNRRYNQQVHPHALLLEIGGAKSTINEAKRSADLLADVLASLIK